jgi:hypothetical protein
VRPSCEAYGYLLDHDARCAYLEDYRKLAGQDANAPSHTCLCTEMRRFRV